MVFKGNPGTGKTTVARIMADIYYALGKIKRGQLVEVEGADLVAGYVGQTAIKTKEVIEKAMGGVLFIDEAYTLASESNKFGQEAIDTLLTALENHRKDFVTIVAGYDKLIDDFVQSNPGLNSRFPTYIHFDDYNAEGLFTIFERMAKKEQFVYSGEVREKLRAYFDRLYANRDKNFGNAREVRNFFGKVKRRQSMRIAKIKGAVTKAMLTEILPEDLAIDWVEANS